VCQQSSATRSHIRYTSSPFLSLFCFGKKILNKLESKCTVALKLRFLVLDRGILKIEIIGKRKNTDELTKPHRPPGDNALCSSALCSSALCSSALCSSALCSSTLCSSAMCPSVMYSPAPALYSPAMCSSVDVLLCAVLLYGCAPLRCAPLRLRVARPIPAIFIAMMSDDWGTITTQNYEIQ
jgi:hypothetical protein